MVKTQLEDGVDVTSPLDVLECIIVTPEATVLKSTAQFIALPLYDGEIGILPGHSGMIGRLGFGELRLREGNRTLRYYVDGGFVEVSNGHVSVLTNRAIPAEKISVEGAREQLEAARNRPAHGEELLEIRERAVAAARGQLRVARRAHEAQHTGH